MSLIYAFGNKIYSVYALVFVCYSFVICRWKLSGLCGGKNNKCLDLKQCWEELQGYMDIKFYQYFESYGYITDVVITFDLP